MTDSKYSEALLDEKFSTIEEKMDTHFEAHTSILKDIKEQTTKTNGRVTDQEKKQIENEAAHAVLMKGMSRSSWTNNLVWGCTFAFPLLAIWAIWLTSETLNSQKTLSEVQQAAIEKAVSNSLKETLNSYDIEP